MAAKVDEVKTVRAHLIVLLLSCICLGIMSCWYAARTSEVYDKMRNTDFHIPKEILDKTERSSKAEGGVKSKDETGSKEIKEKSVDEVTPKNQSGKERGEKTDDSEVEKSTSDEDPVVEDVEHRRRRRETRFRRKPKYYQLFGTPIEPIMSVFENSIKAIEVSNSLCYSTGVLAILSGFWFLAAHCLIFESGQKTLLVMIINWLVYFVLICVGASETVSLSKKMAMIPVMKNLADNIPLVMKHDDLYEDFILLCGNLGPVLIANTYIVIILVSWFQARIVLTKFFSSIYETKEMETRRPINAP